MITVSPELIKAREEQIAESMKPPSGALITWKEMFDGKHGRKREAGRIQRYGR